MKKSTLPVSDTVAQGFRRVASQTGLSQGELARQALLLFIATKLPPAVGQAMTHGLDLDALDGTDEVVEQIEWNRPTRISSLRPTNMMQITHNPKTSAYG